MELIFLYFWMKLNTIIDVANLFAVGAGILYAILAFWIRGSVERGPFGEKEEEKDRLLKKTWPYRRLLIILFCVFGSISSLLPNAKETAVLVGGYYALQFTNSEEGKKVKTLIQLTANNILDDAIKSATK